MRVESVVLERESVESQGRKKEGGGGGEGVMDTPERNKSNQIATPISKFEDSPVFNFLNSLSPIKPVKSVHITQSFNSLSFASLPSVFTSPHVSTVKESRFLRRHQLPDPSKPEFSSDNDHRVERPVGNDLDVANDASEKEESFDPQSCIVDDSVQPSPHESTKISSELVRTLDYECSSPNSSPMPSSGVKNRNLLQFAGSSVTIIPLVQDVSGKGLMGSEVDRNKEASGCEWESLMPDAADLLIFDSPNDAEAFKKAMDSSPRSVPFVANEIQNMETFSTVSYGELVGDGSETQNQSAQPGGGNELHQYSETQDIIPDSSLNNAMTGGPNEIDAEMVSGLYRGMRRRCLVFEMNGARRQPLDDNSGSSSSILAEHDGNTAEKHLVAVNESSRRVLPGIGLHLNALAVTPRDGKGAKHESFASSGKQLIIAPTSAANYHLITTSQESLNNSLAVVSSEREIVPTRNGASLNEDASQEPRYVGNEELSQTSPKKKKRKVDSKEGESCKRCNCKKSKCLKLYCECFAAGVYCVEPCLCQECFNKPIHEDMVLATRKQIESRNPLAFAPKVIRSTDSMSETGDDSNKTPASARHKRGCNCKKSGCLKKYCECYQGGVGCSINCRCEGCKNAFGRKDGSDPDLEDEETDLFEKSVVERSSQKLAIAQNEIEHIPDSALPATPLRLKRPQMQFPFPSKNKPPRSSFLSIGSSSGSQGLGRPSFFQSLPKFDKQFETIKEDENEMPEVLQTTCRSPISGIKSGSPNSKRVSPPHHHHHSSEFGTSSSSSPGRRSSRKLILQSIPTFPSLTPNQ
ncbi:PREDICTED: protein tesmin/TSO1-like CXC 2 [Ipomoea nil]|uniref:protein tesmin/TSO1-like CXC 2 n=1 Tax=Ipomoea nil TaxID=35883 RepID=UPI000901A8DE|nr:PREDICTED: protein tesmin/TSO1-like CXC 2 [Ipomoea nil]